MAHTHAHTHKTVIHFMLIVLYHNEYWDPSAVGVWGWEVVWEREEAGEIIYIERALGGNRVNMWLSWVNPSTETNRYFHQGGHSSAFVPERDKFLSGACFQMVGTFHGPTPKVRNRSFDILNHRRSSSLTFFKRLLLALTFQSTKSDQMQTFPLYL